MLRTDNCYPLVPESSIQESLIASFKEGVNPSLRYHRNSELLANLALNILERIKRNTDSEHILTIVHSLIKNQDYRLVADYLYAQRTNKKEILNIFERLIAADNPIEINRIRYRLAFARFLSAVPCPGKAEISIVSHLDDVFSESLQGTAVYLIDSAMESPLLVLLHDVGAELRTFIEQQYNFPGLCQTVKPSLANEIIPKNQDGSVKNNLIIKPSCLEWGETLPCISVKP
jgi:hypothetical protein